MCDISVVKVTHTQTHAHENARGHTHTNTCTCKCMHADTYTHTHTHAHTHTHTTRYNHAPYVCLDQSLSDKSVLTSLQSCQKCSPQIVLSIRPPVPVSHPSHLPLSVPHSWPPLGEAECTPPSSSGSADSAPPTTGESVRGVSVREEGGERWGEVGVGRGRRGRRKERTEK